jgi:hypothetical protein
MPWCTALERVSGKLSKLVAICPLGEEQSECDVLLWNPDYSSQHHLLYTFFLKRSSFMAPIYCSSNQKTCRTA